MREGHFSDAEMAALQMANSSPYDVLAQMRAIPYVQLTAELTPEKQAYLDRLVKIFPETLAFRAIIYEWAGKYLDAAADYANIIDLQTGFSPDNNPPALPAILGLRSVMLALGGKLDEFKALAADTSAMIRVLNASGKAALMQSPIDGAEQALDFQAIFVDLASGRASAARTKFAARSHWSVPATPVVADLAARLRQNAPSGELIGLLATDPATLRSDGLVANAGAITEANNADASLYGTIRPPMDAATYRSWSDDVWDTKTSIFLHKRAANENYAGELMMVPRTPRFFRRPTLLLLPQATRCSAFRFDGAGARRQRLCAVSGTQTTGRIFCPFRQSGRTGDSCRSGIRCRNCYRRFFRRISRSPSQGCRGGSSVPANR